VYTQLRDSAVNESNRKATMQRYLRYNYDKKAAADSIRNLEEKKVSAAQIAAQRSALKQEQTQRYALYGGLSLLIVFGIFIFNRFKVTQKQKHIIEIKNKETEEQKVLIEEKQKEIVDSINYARRIQYALLANDEVLDNNLPEYFTFFKPKDIVSGDFYWATVSSELGVQSLEKRGRHPESNLGEEKIKSVSNTNGGLTPNLPDERRQAGSDPRTPNFYLAVCDCTGHGVPGAFMSLLNIGFLSEGIKEKKILAPNQTFDYVRRRLVDSISQEGQKDGMDGILCRFNFSEYSFSYCAANNAPLLVSEGAITELPYDKMPVGKGERAEPFTLYTVNVKKGDSLYLYTDGYADQFGGPKGKKFKYKKLNELLLQNSDKPVNEQKKILEAVFDEWKGRLEQVDDVCVIGVRF
jgi:serine phosphatase RsbU (regulator of sigma subunit)